MKCIYQNEDNGDWHRMFEEMPPITSDVEVKSPDGKIIPAEIVVEMSGYYIYFSGDNSHWGDLKDYEYWRFIQKRRTNMNKYIDAEKLKSIIKAQIKERKEWMKDIDRSDRQDQLWSDLNREDMSILQTIDSLHQEQPDVDLEKEIDCFWDSCIKHKNERGGNVIWSNKLEIEALFRYVFELGLKSKQKDG